VGEVVVRSYRDQDEQGWVRCRVLSFVGSAYFDDVRPAKEHYDGAAIELVAEEDGEIVGLIDVECELAPGTICEDRPGLGGMIWHLAVHPDHQRRGVARQLLAEAERRAHERGIERFEAWTRDDADVQAWYESSGFEQVQSYLHVYVELHEGLRELFPITEGLRPVKLFAHYLGADRDAVKQRFERVHDCVLYEYRLSPGDGA
jgi:GNAT superfamily N-acetyltransferase